MTEAQYTKYAGYIAECLGHDYPGFACSLTITCNVAGNDKPITWGISWEDGAFCFAEPTEDKTYGFDGLFRFEKFMGRGYLEEMDLEILT